jgi:hypothetical protein
MDVKKGGRDRVWEAHLLYRRQKVIEYTEKVDDGVFLGPS